MRIIQRLPEQEPPNVAGVYGHLDCRHHCVIELNQNDRHRVQEVIHLSATRRSLYMLCPCCHFLAPMDEVIA